jgi:pyruvate formate lyase activating enzyme
MRIAGINKTSLSDYPGKVAAVIFTQGCPLRCVFCHNESLVKPEKFQPCMPEEEVLGFLESRRGRLDGVVITGGEPTVQADLSDFLRKTREMGYAIKLDTSGVNPNALRDILEARLVDYVAMDLKAPPEKLARMTRLPAMPALVRKSIDIILNSGIDHEFRTTFVPALLEETDVWKIGEMIPGAHCYALQEFVYHPELDEELDVDLEDRQIDPHRLKALLGEMQRQQAFHAVDFRIS